MLPASSFNSELTLPGIFDFVGSSLVGNAFEFPSGGSTSGNLAVTRLIQVDQQIDFQFSWQVAGIFANIINPNSVWEIELFFEQYGPNEIASNPAFRKTLRHGSGTPGFNLMSFPGTPANSTTISLASNTLPVCVCDVVAVVRLLQSNGVTPCFLAAFAEYGKIQFYQE